MTILSNSNYAEVTVVVLAMGLKPPVFVQKNYHVMMLCFNNKFYNSFQKT